MDTTDGTLKVLLREWMEKTGTTQKALAERIGVRPETITTWMSQGRVPSSERVIRALRDVTGVLVQSPGAGATTGSFILGFIALEWARSGGAARGQPDGFSAKRLDAFAIEARRYEGWEYEDAELRTDSLHVTVRDRDTGDREVLVLDWHERPIRVRSLSEERAERPASAPGAARAAVVRAAGRTRGKEDDQRRAQRSPEEDTR